MIPGLDWIGTAGQVIGLGFNWRKSKWCWPVWISSNLAFGTYAYQTDQMSILALNGIFFVMNFYGWYVWARDDIENEPKTMPARLDYYPAFDNLRRSALEVTACLTAEQRTIPKFTFDRLVRFNEELHIAMGSTNFMDTKRQKQRIEMRQPEHKREALEQTDLS